MIDESESEPVEVERVSFPGMSAKVDRYREDEEVRRAERTLFEAIALKTLREIAPTSIEGRHIYFMGNGPYRQEFLEEWVEKLGAFARSEEFDIAKADWFVLGRADFDRQGIHSLSYCDVRIFSQEEFLGLLLFGEESLTHVPYHEGPNPHPALQWVWACEVGFEDLLEPENSHATPSDQPNPTHPAEGPVYPELVIATDDPDPLTPLRPSHQETAENEPFDGTLELQVESELKKLGYSVAKGISLARRHMSLEKGVQVLGYSKVVNHLAWLMRVGRTNPYQQNAVSRWNEDLNWLRSREVDH